MPLNQLGTLYASENYGCDAAYYYLYCLSCTEPFASTPENLRLVLSKNRRRYQEIKGQSFLNADSDDLDELRTKEIKRLVEHHYNNMNIDSNSILLLVFW